MAERSVAMSLSERLGIPALDADLLERALTHRSFAAEHPGTLHNERLELLGDAVLGLAVSSALYLADPDANEGVLSRRRAHLVREGSLATAARAVDLGAELRLGRGEAASGGADKDSLLADALEAVIGAVHLEHGYLVAQTLVARLLGARLVEVATWASAEDTTDDVGPIDAKTALQERAAALGLGVPEYEFERDGPDHAPSFRAVVRLQRLEGSGGASVAGGVLGDGEDQGDGAVLGEGRGGTKKAATQAAAAEALRRPPLG
jgi:ribonuclease III